MTDKVYTDDDIANMSDEELMGMEFIPQAPPVAEVIEEDPDTPDEPVVEEEPDAPAAAVADPDGDDGDDEPDGDAGGEDLAPAKSATTAPAGKAKPAQQPAPAVADKGAKPATAEKPEVKAADGDIDYKAAYDLIMAPFKANGKEVKLQSPDEVVRLVQMGANYTKKLQALQPHLKMIKMLENNGLLDEGKLTYLIDLDKKNPAAIQKFIKESGVDPLEIDTSAEPSYKPGNHKVSDEEMAFNATLDDLMVDPAGADTIVHVNKTWDQPSKAALLKDPQILRVIAEQRQSGIYKKITDEVDRRKLFGAIPTGQPFIQTYMQVGKDMDDKGLLAPPSTTAAAQQPSRIVETRAATKAAKVSNSDKARAASPTSTTPKKAALDFNPLAMSDEEFEKNSELAKKL